MRHNERSDNGESGVAQMHALLSAFERGIDGAGPLMEGQDMAELRRELHSSCSHIRDALNGLSDGTLRLERAAKKYMQRTNRLSTSMAVDEKELTSLKPELWPRA